MKSFRRQYTHFLSLPFIRQDQRLQLASLQQHLALTLSNKYDRRDVVESSSKLAHITFCMLGLESKKVERKTEELLRNLKQELRKTLDNTQLSFLRLGYFSRYNYQSKKSEVSVIYLEAEEDEHFNKVILATDLLIRAILREGIIEESDLKRLRIRYNKKEQLYKAEAYHLTLFRLKNVEQNEEFKHLFSQMRSLKLPIRFHCDFVDVSTRFSYESSGFYRPLERVILESSE